MRATHRIRNAIAKVVPGWQAMERIDATRQEFQIEGRTLHSPRFPTHSGRARMHRHTLPPLAAGDRQLRLMTVRSEGQFNTVVYEEEDIYRGQDRRDVILLHPQDMARWGCGWSNESPSGVTPGSCHVSWSDPSLPSEPATL